MQQKQKIEESQRNRIEHEEKIKAAKEKSDQEIMRKKNV